MDCSVESMATLRRKSVVPRCTSLSRSWRRLSASLAAASAESGTSDSASDGPDSWPSSSPSSFSFS
eukprot:CAMPEP_0196792678 /NCGR_PEP_ID=MMETSP1104-20130614/31818_1 /TAXON_ID=33652 /ORGANISM="Cafeteria sp., Strain Caron Lab Isolate" /LENGTH=65 /DNA_ID=CAMNT_0042163043 /DNA_START=16 /DNA_END=209 /DNA_ORIENTATION=+